MTNKATYVGELGKRRKPSLEMELVDGITARLRDRYHLSADRVDAARKKLRPKVIKGKHPYDPLWDEVRGFTMLFEHYGIPDNMPELMKYRELALALAKDHVPYFGVPKRRGRSQILKSFAALADRINGKDLSFDRQQLAFLAEIVLSRVQEELMPDEVSERELSEVLDEYLADVDPDTRARAFRSYRNAAPGKN